jgi:hypothetical protein
VERAESRKGKEKAKPTPKPKSKPPKLNTDNLPILSEILSKLGLSRFNSNFIKMGVGETRLLVRLSRYTPYTHTYTHTHIHIHIHTYIHTPQPLTHIHTHTHTYPHTRIY